MKDFIVVASFIGCILLSGCASNHTPSTRSNSNTDPSNITLAEAATSVSSSLENLAATEQAAFHPIANQSLPDPSTYGMGGASVYRLVGPH